MLPKQAKCQKFSFLTSDPWSDITNIHPFSLLDIPTIHLSQSVHIGEKSQILTVSNKKNSFFLLVTNFAHLKHPERV
jgi:hypothetical protein